MSLNLQKRPFIREKKLNATNAYYGNWGNLLAVVESDELKQRIRTFSQVSTDEIIYTLESINGIENSVIIIHGPAGCASAQLNLYLKDSGRPWLVTNLTEQDSILGGDSKLREAVGKALEKYNPKVIFIVSTPVVAINNDDIQSIIYELEEEVEIPIIPIYSDGFKSKISAYGYDLALHAVAKYILPSAQKTEKSNFVNIISISESDRQLRAITKILNDLGINYNTISRNSSIDNIKKSVNAKATVAIDKVSGNFLAELLRDEFNIPYIETSSPIGIKATNKWIIDISRELGIEEEANKYILKNLKSLDKAIKSNVIGGRKIYINHLPTAAFELSKLLEELNAEIAGITVEYIDNISVEELKRFRDKDKEAKIHVSTGQIFEVLNIVKKVNPDLYIGRAADSVWVSKSGIKSIALDSEQLYGYEGIAKILKEFSKVFDNDNLEGYLSDNIRLPYHENWFGKSTNWYIKQEVK
ncbi:MAG: nitrogenase component 1 [Clostridiaceae bacterium]